MTAALAIPSTPTLSGFNPGVIEYQRQVVDLVRSDFDYSKGNLELLLSGSYGSAKSTLLAHLAVTHCLLYPRARCAIARRARDDLKRTIWAEILEHIGDDLTEGVDYWLNLSDLKVTFCNGSEIVAAYWGDKRYKKFRSWKLSMLIIEEIVENDDQDEEAFKQLKARLRRLPHVAENLLAAATNPDAPTHWVYRYFIEPNPEGAAPHPTRRVFYSLTEQNPFLDPVYVEQLRADLSPKEADRYLRGRWIELQGEVVYCEYDSAAQYRRNTPYAIVKGEPIWLTFDFNIGEGKPMSAVMFQHVGGTFHFFNEVVIEGARTADLIEEWDARGSLALAEWFILTGDAAGKHKDTRNVRSDYDIIKHELGLRGKRVEYVVPLANPAIRTRHNRVNAYCKNDKGERRLFLYQGCKMLDEALRLTKLKKGGDYIEDDSKAYQHVGTALGYGILTALTRATTKRQGTTQL